MGLGESVKSVRSKSLNFSVRTDYTSNIVKRRVLLFWCCFGITAVLVLAMAIYITTGASISNELADININRSTQIARDWRQEFFTEVNLRLDDCKYNEDVVFSKTWGGLEMGCLLEADWFEDAQVVDYYTW